MENINRKLHTLDATNKSVGRLASQIALLLRGKNKPEYLPHLDLGDNVLVVNSNKIKFSGKKIDQKKYFKYSGFPGGLKETKLRDLLKIKPTEVLKRAVRQMLPKTKFREKLLQRLVIK